MIPVVRKEQTFGIILTAYLAITISKAAYPTYLIATLIRDLVPAERVFPDWILSLLPLVQSAYSPLPS